MFEFEFCAVFWPLWHSVSRNKFLLDMTALDQHFWETLNGKAHTQIDATREHSNISYYNWVIIRQGVVDRELQPHADPSADTKQGDGMKQCIQTDFVVR